MWMGGVAPDRLGVCAVVEIGTLPLKAILEAWNALEERGGGSGDKSTSRTWAEMLGEGRTQGDNVLTQCRSLGGSSMSARALRKREGKGATRVAVRR